MLINLKQNQTKKPIQKVITLIGGLVSLALIANIVFVSYTGKELMRLKEIENTEINADINSTTLKKDLENLDNISSISKIDYLIFFDNIRKINDKLLMKNGTSQNLDILYDAYRNTTPITENEIINKYQVLKTNLALLLSNDLIIESRLYVKKLRIILNQKSHDKDISQSLKDSLNFID